MEMYRYIRWLSLDIVLGAVVLLHYLGNFYSVTFPASVYLALASAVWLIYTLDHLIDARKVESPTSDRHRFHKKHLRTLQKASMMVLMVALVNVFFLPEVIIRNGTLLASACTGYLLLVFLSRKRWVKEFWVALIYAMGIFLAPFSMGQMGGWDVFLLSQLILIAFLNLIIFSFYDHELDQHDGFHSIVVRLGRKNSAIAIHGISLLTLALTLTGWAISAQQIELVFLLMSVALYNVFLFPVFFHRHERFRIVGDAVFFLPSAFLI